MSLSYLPLSKPICVQGGRGAMRCNYTHNPMEVIFDIIDLNPMSTNYLQSLCFSVRHIQRVEMDLDGLLEIENRIDALEVRTVP